MQTTARTSPTILLVEDDPDDVLLFQRALSSARARDRVVLASDGEQAMRLLRDRRPGKAPSLVLLDLNLPRMNGFEFLEEVRSDEDLRTLPIIVLTSSRSDTDVLESYARQANAFVRKPSTLEGFRNLIDRVEGFWLETATLPCL